jgi:hypothetical protein
MASLKRAVATSVFCRSCRGMLALLLVSCSADGPGDEPDAAADTGPAECPPHLPFRFGDSCCQFEDGSACEQIWCGVEDPWIRWDNRTPLWWSADEPSSCADTLSHSPPQPYDDCYTGADPRLCGLPHSGALECIGYWAITCESSVDCPAGMGCTYHSTEGLVETPEEVPSGDVVWGHCVKRCTTVGSSDECIRCDQVCQDGGFCDARGLMPGHTCVADCECWDVVDPATGSAVCNGGRCYPGRGRPRVGLCGDGYDCACVGGTCEAHPEGGCCRLPDGTIAGPESEACGADAGVP